MDNQKSEQITIRFGLVLALLFGAGLLTLAWRGCEYTHAQEMAAIKEHAVKAYPGALVYPEHRTESSTVITPAH